MLLCIFFVFSTLHPRCIDCEMYQPPPPPQGMMEASEGSVIRFAMGMPDLIRGSITGTPFRARPSFVNVTTRAAVAAARRRRRSCHDTDTVCSWHGLTTMQGIYSKPPDPVFCSLSLWICRISDKNTIYPKGTLRHIIKIGIWSSLYGYSRQSSTTNLKIHQFLFFFPSKKIKLKKKQKTWHALDFAILTDAV